MCSKQNIRFNSEHFQRDYRNKWIKNIYKHISWECKCKFDCRKCNSNQKWNNGKCQPECNNLKRHHACKNIIFGIFLHVVVKMVNI